MSRFITLTLELFKNEALFDAEIITKLPLRLVFIGLLVYVDYKGCFKWRPRNLKVEILPYEDIDFSKILEVLQQKGFIEKYEHNANFYGFIPDWSKYQQITYKKPVTDIPEPSSVTSNLAITSKML